jgi:hypothetical protein
VPSKTEGVLYSVYQFQQDGHVDVKMVILLKVMAHHMKGREHNDQTFEDTKGLIRRHKSMKVREHNGHKFEDTKGVISIFKLLDIALSVLHQFMASDYPFGIFKLFLYVYQTYNHNKLRILSSRTLNYLSFRSFDFQAGV